MLTSRYAIVKYLVLLNTKNSDERNDQFVGEYIKNSTTRRSRHIQPPFKIWLFISVYKTLRRAVRFGCHIKQFTTRVYSPKMYDFTLTANSKWRRLDTFGCRSGTNWLRLLKPDGRNSNVGGCRRPNNLTSSLGARRSCRRQNGGDTTRYVEKRVTSLGTSLSSRTVCLTVNLTADRPEGSHSWLRRRFAKITDHRRVSKTTVHTRPLDVGNFRQRQIGYDAQSAKR